MTEKILDTNVVDVETTNEKDYWTIRKPSFMVKKTKATDESQPEEKKPSKVGKILKGLGLAGLGVLAGVGISKAMSNKNDLDDDFDLDEPIVSEDLESENDD